MSDSTPVLLIGGGMIAHDQILPALFQMQREGRIGEITVASTRVKTVRALAEAPALSRAFPGQSFRAMPDFRAGDDGRSHPETYKQALADLPTRSVVIVATPDQTHFPIVMDALRAEQHVICVKPLVLKVEHSEAIEEEANRRSLFVGVEYHKRFDPRSLLARRRFREGLFGELKLGAAVLMEKWHYRESNFQNWFTCEETDAFTYIGCHYVDLVHFITGLEPRAVSVYGVKDRFPNGNEGFLWTDARVIWNNDACLNVQNSLCFPDAAPGPNTQGMVLYFSGGGNGALLEHSDQYRGLKYSFTENPGGAGATQYAEPSPDYFCYQDMGGSGLIPTGYGVRSVDALVTAALEIEAGEPLDEERRRRIRTISERAILATPENSRFNERLLEAGRKSILDGGRLVEC